MKCEICRNVVIFGLVYQDPKDKHFICKRCFQSIIYDKEVSDLIDKKILEKIRKIPRW